jgi:hypothetical protein
MSGDRLLLAGRLFCVSNDDLLAPFREREREKARSFVVIDQALSYYNCLSSSSESDKRNAAKNYVAFQQELLARRSAEIADMKAKGYVNAPTTAAPKTCARQP